LFSDFAAGFGLVPDNLGSIPTYSWVIAKSVINSFVRLTPLWLSEIGGC